jgi:hypothetical protein
VLLTDAIYLWQQRIGGGVSAQTLIRCSTSNATTNIWAWDSDGGRRRRQRCRRFAQTRLVVRPGRGRRLPLSAYVQLHKVLLAGWTRRTASQTSGRPSGAVAQKRAMDVRFDSDV